MFGYVFDRVPGYSVAYPTEGFYYFQMTLGDRQVTGNLRLADLDSGKLTFAYFDARTLETSWTVVDETHGLSVKKHSDHLYTVGYGGRNVRFKLTDVAEKPPRRIRLLDEEAFVGQVYDESGVRFFLLFNDATDSFYYVLNDERGPTERLRPAGTHFLIGERTGFVYYDDPEFNRRVLVGLDYGEVATNTFLDGPPDQVPFRVNVRERLYRAYPGYALGTGVDPTGVTTRDGEWARVAIAPLHRYVSVPDLVDYLAAIVEATEPGSIRWSALTKERWNTVTWLEQVRADLAAEGKPFRMPAWALLLADGRFPYLTPIVPVNEDPDADGAPSPG